MKIIGACAVVSHGCGLREARAEIKLEAVKETQAIVNSVQGRLYGELRSLAVAVDRQGRSIGTDRHLAPSLAPTSGGRPADGDSQPD